MSVKHAARRDAKSTRRAEQSTRAHQRVRRRAARRPAERQGDPRAGGARGAVHAASPPPGCGAIEAASFVHPEARAADGGRRGGLRGARRPTTATTYASLVLNRKGLDRALADGARRRSTSPTRVTDTFAQRNQNTTVEEAARDRGGDHRARTEAAARSPRRSRSRSAARSRATSTPGWSIEHARRMAAAGADEVILADTIGVGVPRQVRELVPRALEGAARRSACTCTTRATPATRTRSPGSSTARRSSTRRVGGLGGCPFAPRATGNIATEDLVYLLEDDGRRHGRRASTR